MDNEDKQPGPTLVVSRIDLINDTLSDINDAQERILTIRAMLIPPDDNSMSIKTACRLDSLAAAFNNLNSARACMKGAV